MMRWRQKWEILDLRFVCEYSNSARFPRLSADAFRWWTSLMQLWLWGATYFRCVEKNISVLPYNYFFHTIFLKYQGAVKLKLTTINSYFYVFDQ